MGTILTPVYYQVMDVIPTPMGVQDFRFTVPYPKEDNEVFDLHRAFDLTVNRVSQTMVNDLSIFCIIHFEGLAMDIRSSHCYTNCMAFPVSRLPPFRRSELPNRIYQQLCGLRSNHFLLSRQLIRVKYSYHNLM